MIQNKLFYLAVIEKKTSRVLPIGECSDCPYVPDEGFIKHRDGSYSVTFSFPEVETDREAFTESDYIAMKKVK